MVTASMATILSAIASKSQTLPQSLWRMGFGLALCALPLLASPAILASSTTPTSSTTAPAGALTNNQLLLSDEQFKSLENKSVGIDEIMRAHERETRGKPTQEKIHYYQKLLEVNNIAIKPIPYKSQDYIEARFGDESLDKRHKRSRYYTTADKKSGAFSGITLGFASLTQNYQDGLYNRTNNVPKDEAGFICTDTDKSGCKTSGIFLNAANPGGINIESDLFVFGGGFGYQKFFNPYFGTRLYGDGMLSTGSEKLGGEKIGSLWYVLGGMNVDLLAELPFSLFVKRGFFKESAIGVYGGLSIGVMLLFDKADEKAIQKHIDTSAHNYKSKDILWNYLLQVDYGFNLGFSFSITSRYKVDFGAKVPMSAVGLPSELRLGLESTADYSYWKPDSTTNDPNKGEYVQEPILSKDIIIKRTPTYYVSFIMLF